MNDPLRKAAQELLDAERGLGPMSHRVAVQRLAAALLTAEDRENLREVVESQARLGHSMTIVPNDVLLRLLAALASPSLDVEPRRGRITAIPELGIVALVEDAPALASPSLDEETLAEAIDAHVLRDHAVPGYDMNGGDCARGSDGENICAPLIAAEYDRLTTEER